VTVQGSSCHWCWSFCLPIQRQSFGSLPVTLQYEFNKE
jgi:hypothetical protein